MSSADKYTKPIDSVVSQLAELQLLASRFRSTICHYLLLEYKTIEER